MYILHKSFYTLLRNRVFICGILTANLDVLANRLSDRSVPLDIDLVTNEECCIFHVQTYKIVVESVCNLIRCRIIRPLNWLHPQGCETVIKSNCWNECECDVNNRWNR